MALDPSSVHNAPPATDFKEAEHASKRGWLIRDNFYVLFPLRMFCVLEDGVLSTYLSANSTRPSEKFVMRDYYVRRVDGNQFAFYLQYRDERALGPITPLVAYYFSSVSEVSYVEDWILTLQLEAATPQVLVLLKEVETKDVTLSAGEFEAVERAIAPQVDEARRHTRSLLATPCSGRAGEKDTAVHVLSALAKSMGKEALFFDGNACQDLPDSLTTPHIALHEDTQKFDVHLEDASDIVGDDEKVDLAELDVDALDTVVKTGQGSPAQMSAIATLRQKLARAHGVSPDDIIIESFYDGSFAFKYSVNTKARSVDDLSAAEVASVQQAEQNLQQEFGKFKSMGIHPLFYRMYFDVNMFDEAGNKDFTNASSSFTLGKGCGDKEQQYKQPTGWYGYGLKVLHPKTDKFGTDNSWLDPFQNPNMWHKAYHGTGSLKADRHANKLPSARNGDDRQVWGMASIHKNGMRPADITAFGPGVYCGKSVKFFTEGGGKSFLGEAEIDTKSGKETWQFLMMVAIKPGGYDEKEYHAPGEVNKFYLVHKKEDVRPYRLLFRRKP